MSSCSRSHSHWQGDLTIGDGVDDAVDGKRAVVKHAGGHGLGAHEVAAAEKRRQLQKGRGRAAQASLRQHASIRGESGDGDTNVVVDADELLLVRSELSSGTLQGNGRTR